MNNNTPKKVSRHKQYHKKEKKLDKYLNSITKTAKKDPKTGQQLIQRTILGRKLVLMKFILMYA